MVCGWRILPQTVSDPRRRIWNGCLVALFVLATSSRASSPSFARGGSALMPGASFASDTISALMAAAADDPLSPSVNYEGVGTGREGTPGSVRQRTPRAYTPVAAGSASRRTTTPRATPLSARSGASVVDEAATPDAFGAAGKTIAAATPATAATFNIAPSPSTNPLTSAASTPGFASPAVAPMPTDASPATPPMATPEAAATPLTKPLTPGAAVAQTPTSVPQRRDDRRVSFGPGLDEAEVRRGAGLPKSMTSSHRRRRVCSRTRFFASVHLETQRFLRLGS